MFLNLKQQRRGVTIRARRRTKERQKGREQLWEVGDNFEVNGRAGQSGTGGER